MANTNTFPLSGNAGIGTTTPRQSLTLGAGNILLPDADHGIHGNLYFGGITDMGETGMRLFGGKVNQPIPTFPATPVDPAILAGFIDVCTPDPSDGLRIRVDTTIGGTERMRITAEGNVGIGSTTPANKLHLHGQSANFALTFTNAANTPGQQGYRIAFDNDRLTFQQADDAGLFMTNHLAIMQDTGNVGIGTTSPKEKLHVISPTLAVLGESGSGIGVKGKTDNGTGVLGETGGGIAVHGINVSLRGFAGRFDGNVVIAPVGGITFQADDIGLGFFGVPTVARPTITGSRGGNAAVASLLTELSTLGLLVDSTTP